MGAYLYNKVVIAGVGLMGGSLGLALKKEKLAGQVTGLARKATTIKKALRIGALDNGTTEPACAAVNADLVVMAGPVSSTPVLFKQFMDHLPRRCIITDVGSTKAGLVKQMNTLVGQANRRLAKQMVYIGAHPMAGSEKTGVEASRADLYEQAVCIMIKQALASRTQAGKLKKMWKAVGCKTVVELSGTDHDAMTALISHLPHATAVALTASVNSAGRKYDALTELISTGFKDTTRIAAGSPPMWADIFSSNKKFVLSSIKQIQHELQLLEKYIDKDNHNGLISYLEAAKKFRIKLEK